MIPLWRVCVSITLGSLIGSQGYGLWQLRNVSTAWKWAAAGAVIGLVIGVAVWVIDREIARQDANFAKPS